MASDPYEEWKAQGRPGGSFAAWMAEQRGGEAPTEAPTGAPAPAVGGAPPTGGAPATGGWNWTPDPKAAQKAWAKEHPGQPAPANVVEWFKNAVEAGSFLETGESSSETAYEQSGWNAKGQDITGMRAWAKQHGMSEDFDRWSEGQLMAWSKQRDSNCPPQTPFKAFDGSGCVEKPIDSNVGFGNKEGEGGEGGGGGKGKTAAPPPPPPKPVTFGNQLSMTGNPLQDMLISQFNTGQDPMTYQNNIFGLGEDMKVGGTGINADQNGVPTRQAQSLSGGGLWWGQTKDTFGGFDASQKNAEGAATPSPAAPAPPPTASPAAVQPQAQTQPAIRSRMGGAHVGGPARPRNFGQTGQTPVSGMLLNRYGGRPSYS